MSIGTNLELLSNKQNNKLENQGRLLVKCPDKPGIVSVLSTFLHNDDSNIIESSQYPAILRMACFSYAFSFIQRIY